MDLLATFGNLAGFDGVFILLVLLLVAAAKRNPDLAKGLDLAAREFGKTMEELRKVFSLEGLASLAVAALVLWAIALVCFGDRSQR